MTERTIARLLLVLVAAMAVLHLTLIFRLNINWDEFRFLSDIYRLHDGTLASPLQTFHVQLFRWLTAVGKNEIDQILIARFVYYLLLLGSCGFIYLIARRFFSTAAALFVLLCYLSYNEIVAHATAFRFDGLGVFLLLAALALLMRAAPTKSAVAVSAALTAIAILVTVKSVFYLPTLTVVLAVVSYRHRARHFALFTLSFLLALGAAYALHSMNLPTVGQAAPVAMLRTRSQGMLGPHVLTTTSEYLIRSVLLNIVVWFLILQGAVAVTLRLVKSGPRRDALALLALIIPLGSLAIYRNAFPYFYVFVMPPAIVLCGFSFSRLLAKLPGGSPQLRLCALIIVITLSFVGHYARHRHDEIDVQRAVVEAVHAIFPEPVPYIDRSSMIASFPKVGFFMSTGGFQSYHGLNRPIFEDLLRAQAPRFLIANHPALILDSTVAVPSTPGAPRLRQDDVDVLAANFVHHWGPIWVAGKRLSLGSGEAWVEILIPGVYTLESGGPVTIDAVTYEPGAPVRLASGRHSLLSSGRGETITLRWGHKLHRPTTSPPAGALYRSL